MKKSQSNRKSLSYYFSIVVINVRENRGATKTGLSGKTSTIANKTHSQDTQNRTQKRIPPNMINKVISSEIK